MVFGQPRRAALFAKRPCRDRQDLWHFERFGEIAGDAQVGGLGRTRFRREASDDDDRQVGVQPSRLLNDGEAIHAWHLQEGGRSD